MSINQFQQKIQTEPGWHHLSLERIERSQTLPTQAQIKHAKHWSCGPHSGYRALILNGDRMSKNELCSFIDRCPKSLGTPQTKTGKVLNIMTLGVASGIGWFKGDVGPNPATLARYINQHSQSTVRRYITNTWSDFWTELCKDIDRAHPAIILFEYGAISLHYINLVGYNPKNKMVAILDTNNAIAFYSIDQFKKHANIRVPYVRGQWNAVRFQ